MRVKLLAISILGLMVPAALPAGASTVSQLKSKALSISNFPTGWSVDNSTLTGAVGCLSGIRNLSKEEVRVQFTNGNAPAVQEALATGPGALSHFSRVESTLRRCRGYTASSGGQTAHVTVGAMSFPKIGDQSVAYALSLKVQGVTLGADVVLFRVGQIVGAINYEDIGSPDASQAQAFITEAVNKVKGKPTVTPTTF